MPVITDQGFAPTPAITFHPGAEMPEGRDLNVEIGTDADPATLTPRFDEIRLIRVNVPSAADGRGFSIARRLRDLGFKGRLRAAGHVISDQYRMARQSGFDEVEIDDALAARQPEEHWVKAAAPAFDYRRKLTQGGPTTQTIPAGVFAETVTEVEHYTDRLFRFRMTRPASFRFRSGEFAMIGLPNAEKPVFRAYSVASPAWDDTLEFYSIKVPGGPLTEHLQKIRPGDTVLMRKKATGTLVADAVSPGQRLWLFSTGTGIAPFAALIREPEVYAKVDQVILVHTCRLKAELAYGDQIVAAAKADPLVGEEASQKLVHYATTTREESPRRGRITDLISSGKLFSDLGVPALSPEADRAMICGSMEMLRDVKALCEAAGLEEGAVSRPGAFVVERAFVG